MQRDTRNSQSCVHDPDVLIQHLNTVSLEEFNCGIMFPKLIQIEKHYPGWTVDENQLCVLTGTLENATMGLDDVYTFDEYIHPSYCKKVK